MVGQLVPQRLLDLPGQQGRIVAEVPHQGVAVDHDPVFVAFARDPVAEVLAVGAAFEAEIGDHHRHLLQQALELVGQGVDGVRDQGLEVVRLGLIHWRPKLTATDLEHEMSRKLRATSSLFAVIAIAAGGVVWSGCGSDSDTGTVQDSAETQIEQGTQKAEDAVNEGVETTKKGLEEAKKEVESGFNDKTTKKLEEAQKEAEEKLDEGTKQAEKGIEEAKEQAEKYLP